MNKAKTHSKQLDLFLSRSSATYQSNKPLKAFPSRTIIVEYEEGRAIKISIPSSNKETLTCQWLFSEAVTKIREDARKRNIKIDTYKIIALKTKNLMILVDYWLSLPEKSLSVLEDGLVLVPVYGFSRQVSEQKDFSQLSREDFLYEEQIGKGGFAQVFLARSLYTGQFYAIKQIKKMASNRKRINSIVRERDILVKLKGQQRVSQIKFAFQDDEFCYLGLEYFPGGNLHFHLRKEKKFTEDQARIIIAETLLGLQTLHENNILYRDLKPENLMLDFSGHVSITDFGLSKIITNPSELNNSICGTFESIAPEVANGNGYNFSVDYYGLGALTYELVMGVPPSPYLLKDQQGRLCKNPNYKLKLPQLCSDELRDFLRKLFVEDPALRLGAKGGWNEIKKHPWLKSVNFADIVNGNSSSAIEISPLMTYFDSKSLQPRTENNIDDTTFPKKEIIYIPGFEFTSPEVNNRLFAQKPQPKSMPVSKGIGKLNPTSISQTVTRHQSVKRNGWLPPEDPVEEKNMSCPKSSKKVYLTLKNCISPTITVRKTLRAQNKANLSDIDISPKPTVAKFREDLKNILCIKIPTQSTETSPKCEPLESNRPYFNYQEEMDENWYIEQPVSSKLGWYQMNPKFELKSKKKWGGVQNSCT